MSFAALVRKDIVRELRSREAIAAGIVLVLTFWLLALFAGVLEGAALVIAIWAPLVYGAIALCGRGFAGEQDRGTLDLLRAAPVPLAWHGWSRTLLHVLLLSILAGVVVVGAWVGFGAAPTFDLLVILALVVPGLALTATLASAVAAQARMREILLPVLAVPALAPLLQAGVKGTMAALAGDPTSAPWLLAGYDLVVLAVASLLWPFLLEGE